MITMQGKRNTAFIYARTINRETKTQIAELLREKAFTDSKIRIMPDAHSGKGCVVGTTMTLNGRVSPSLVGVDIGCGMETLIFEEAKVDLPALDELIHTRIPCGSRIHGDPLVTAEDIDLSKLRCFSEVNIERAYHSAGTLGGGNHFIELGQDSNGVVYLIIHSGSRQLGSDVAKYYQEAAYKYQYRKAKGRARTEAKTRRERTRYDEHGDYEVYDNYVKLAPMREQKPKQAVAFGRAVLDGALFEDYLYDIAIVQEFAVLNRKTMAAIISEGMGLSARDSFTNVHNYIDTDRMILRKGAVSANQGERLVIPLNMRDGVLLCTGLGNPEWNFSAPHGAGRICSRTDAKYTYSVEEYLTQMQGIYTTTANEGSIDECPMAYKPPGDIISMIDETVTVEKTIKPLYNFKACG